ncbi:DinB family protein [Tepidiforma sp.]|uniref:DinB family protein n=1 Tax=Tepidiforma sp. TaxID=2682230 RepID=UPI002ADD6D75|nr:DinB family protein [Tepidiforma sp.]
MRYVPAAAGSDPSFLLKALGEASGELARAFSGVRERELLRPAPWPDEGWCLLAVPFHLVQVERGFQEQVAIIGSGARGEPEIPHVDLDDIPFEADYAELDLDLLLDELHYLRRRTSYLLWECSERDWRRTGRHPYRGSVSLLELAREAYQHDLEHLWQVRRMREAVGGTGR